MDGVEVIDFDFSSHSLYSPRFWYCRLSYSTSHFLVYYRNSHTIKLIWICYLQLFLCNTKLIIMSLWRIRCVLISSIVCNRMHETTRIPCCLRNLKIVLLMNGNERCKCQTSEAFINFVGFVYAIYIYIRIFAGPRFLKFLSIILSKSKIFSIFTSRWM